jgi:hypothetical protein
MGDKAQLGQYCRTTVTEYGDARGQITALHAKLLAATLTGEPHYRSTAQEAAASPA